MTEEKKTIKAVRKLTNAEVADLPDDANKWHNFSEDPKKYWVAFAEAWEVDDADFEVAKDAGVLCIDFHGTKIVAI